MTFFALGINHKVAPLSLREQLATATSTQQTHLLQGVIAEGYASEAMVLSTCNRTELYCVSPNSNTTLDWLIGEHFQQDPQIRSHFYQHQAFDGVRHAMRVACGLDSMMLGEPQILGQMKRAFDFAQASNGVGTVLHPIFQRVFQATKRVRSCSNIGLHPTSVAYAATQVIRHQFVNQLERCHALLIGAGDTSQLLARHLQKAGVRHFTIASRTRENATALAETLSGRSVAITDIATQLSDVDIVVSATACPVPFITSNMITHSMAQRQQRPLFLLDLSVPRDIEPEVADLPQVTLYNVDNLQDMVTLGLSQRRDAAERAEALIESELEAYIRWHRAQSAKKKIVHYRQQMATIAAVELQRVKQRLDCNRIDHTQALEELKHRLLQKLCHQPTVGLKQAAAEGNEELLAFTQYLLEPTD